MKKIKINYSDKTYTLQVDDGCEVEIEDAGEVVSILTADGDVIGEYYRVQGWFIEENVNGS